MEQRCEETHKKCEYGNPKTVAFFAGLTNNFGPLGQRTDIVLDNVVTNVGSGYFPSTGRFKAPVCGNYQFNFNIAAVHGKEANVIVLKNGIQLMNPWSVCHPEWSPSSCVAVLSLEQGDQVWMQLEGGAFSLYGLMHTTFSGFLIS